MPPELLTAGQLSKAADSYAFGTLLWELLTGERPWDRMQPMQVGHTIGSGAIQDGIEEGLGLKESMC